MGLFTKAIQTLELLATSIALLSINDLSNVNYNSTHENSLGCGFSDDFTHFLATNNYSSYQFNRSDIKCGCFGGKSFDQQPIQKTPIVFVHGNSDIGFGKGVQDGYQAWQTGFRSLATHLIDQGWKKSQLYTTTWGSGDPFQSKNSYHSKKYVMYLRAFVQAVLKYTKSDSIVIVSHSMGVTLVRKAIKGGSATDHVEGNYEVGESLSRNVKVFIGLGGANLGLTKCYDKTQIPVCGEVDGLFPGYLPISGPSKFLKDLNADPQLEGQKVYTIWSKYDDLMGYQCLVWGKVTSQIPNQSQEIVKNTKQWGHYHLRDNIGPDIISWISK